MLSVDEAKDLILSTVTSLAKSACSIAEAGGRVLTEDVKSPMAIPFFDNSAMDGYALRSEETAGATSDKPVSLVQSGIVAAGDDPIGNAQNVAAMHTIQIFTGAMVPPGADAVIRQEDVEVTPDGITIRRAVKRGENIRYKGEEVGIGDVLLRAGERLSPAAVGVLATVCVNEVNVFSKPRVRVIVTGSEIVSDASDLMPGKIFDSNSYVIAAALAEMDIEPAAYGGCADDRDLLRDTIAQGLESSDVLIVSGGVSVGKFDYVKDVAAELGIETVFWKIAQKPGKPMFFGATADRGKLLFGLPGNPASALVCFYEYVRPALMAAMGCKQPFLSAVKTRITHDYVRTGNLTLFLKGSTEPSGMVSMLARQGSHMMSSFAQSNCLVVVPPGVQQLKAGDDVEVHLLPR